MKELKPRNADERIRKRQKELSRCAVCGCTTVLLWDYNHKNKELWWPRCDECHVAGPAFDDLDVAIDSWNSLQSVIHRGRSVKTKEIK